MEREMNGALPKSPLVFPRHSRRYRLGVLFSSVVMVVGMTALTVWIARILGVSNQNLSDFTRESLVLLAFMMVGGGLLLWKLFAMKIFLFPYRFEVHNEEKVSGYRWRSFWCLKYDLSKADAIVVQVYRIGVSWGWRLWASNLESGKNGKIKESFQTFSNDFAASLHAMDDARKIANYLNLPIRFEMGPKAVLEFYAEHFRRLDVMQRNRSYPSKFASENASVHDSLLKDFWGHDYDLSKVDAIVAHLYKRGVGWRWKILVKRRDRWKRPKIQASLKTYDDAFAASFHCMEEATRIAKLLDLPIEYKGWPKGLLDIYVQHYRQLEIMQRNESYPSKLPPDWTSDS